ncbi:MAG: hypothetical protein R3331_03385 [Sulfurospirillaceae bacterium]|nr:hypothetical protein [Sulfurospirillaceae bacterium]
MTKKNDIEQNFKETFQEINHVMQQYPLLIPSSTKKQKIADHLSSINNFITSQVKKLKEHKKGLIHQLFP